MTRRNEPHIGGATAGYTGNMVRVIYNTVEMACDANINKNCVFLRTMMSPEVYAPSPGIDGPYPSDGHIPPLAPQHSILQTPGLSVNEIGVHLVLSKHGYVNVIELCVLLIFPDEAKEESE